MYRILALLLSLRCILAQSWVFPPPKGFTGAQINITVGNTYIIQWSCNYSLVNLNIWQDYVDPQGYEYFFRLIQAQPNTNTTQFTVGSNLVNSTSGNWFFRLYDSDTNGNKIDANTFDSQAFLVVPPPGIVPTQQAMTTSQSTTVVPTPFTTLQALSGHSSTFSALSSQSATSLSPTASEANLIATITLAGGSVSAASSTATAKTSQSSASSSSAAKYILAIVVPILVLVVLAAAAAFLYTRRRRNAQKKGRKEKRYTGRGSPRLVTPAMQQQAQRHEVGAQTDAEPWVRETGEQRGAEEWVHEMNASNGYVYPGVHELQAGMECVSDRR